MGRPSECNCHCGSESASSSGSSESSGSVSSVSSTVSTIGGSLSDSVYNIDCNCNFIPFKYVFDMGESPWDCNGTVREVECCEYYGVQEATYNGLSTKSLSGIQCGCAWVWLTPAVAPEGIDDSDDDTYTYHRYAIIHVNGRVLEPPETDPPSFCPNPNVTVTSNVARYRSDGLLTGWPPSFGQYTSDNWRMIDWDNYKCYCPDLQGQTPWQTPCTPSCLGQNVVCHDPRTRFDDTCFWSIFDFINPPTDFAPKITLNPG